MQAPIHNEDIAHIFEKMSRVLSLKGQNLFRVLAYENAARSIRELDEDLAKVAADGKLEEISGIGKDLAGKIKEALRTGHIRECERECGKIPDSLLALFDVRGLGPKTIALLHKKFRVNTVKDLSRVLDSGALARMRGFGEKKNLGVARVARILDRKPGKDAAWPGAATCRRTIGQDPETQAGHSGGAGRFIAPGA